MPVPESYDDSGITINVEPEMIYQLATVAIPSLGSEIADSVNRISQIWNDLKLGWVGNTAQEAQDFNDRWVSSISELFGAQGAGGGPSTGVLAAIADGVATAGSNYGQAEDVVTNMFNQTTSALGQGSSSDASTDPHRAVDGPISENTPTMPSTGRESPLPPSDPPNPWDFSPPPKDPGALDPPPEHNPWDPTPPPPRDPLLPPPSAPPNAWDPSPSPPKDPVAAPPETNDGIWGLG